ncbi:hypothetical protein [Shewanella halifaxensis]|uniref:hypothetical protein n=1 Tax=Shewanella halifaxensis TaxID=271098 RepID=UPI000D597EA1|nr:hypothetical protein [Shewanella halifaxensis]
MREEILFLITLVIPNDNKIDEISEFIHSNMDLNGIEEIIAYIDEIEINSTIEPYNYQTTKESLYESLHILNTVSDYKKRVLKEQQYKDLFDLNFAY